MRTFMRRAVPALVIAAGLAGAFAAAAPANASAPAGCSAGALCAYWDSNYSQATFGVQKVYQDNDDLTMYRNFYNSAGGSLWNNGGSCNVTVYTGKNGGGSGYDLNRGTGWAVIGSNLPHIESNYWCLY